MSAARGGGAGDALSFALQALQLAPGLIGVFAAVVNMARENRGPTAAEMAELDRALAANSATLAARAEQAKQAGG